MCRVRDVRACGLRGPVRGWWSLKARENPGGTLDWGRWWGGRRVPQLATQCAGRGARSLGWHGLSHQRLLVAAAAAPPPARSSLGQQGRVRCCDRGAPGHPAPNSTISSVSRSSRRDQEVGLVQLGGVGPRRRRRLRSGHTLPAHCLTYVHSYRPHLHEPSVGCLCHLAWR